MTLAGPYGPLGTEGEWELIRGKLMEGNPLAAAAAILDAVEAPPPLPPNVSFEAFSWASSEVLARLGKQPGVLDYLCQQLERPKLCMTLVEALDMLGDPRAALALATLAHRPIHALTTEQWLSLMSALGNVRGPGSFAVVEMLLSRDGWLPEVREELELALRRLV